MFFFKCPSAPEKDDGSRWAISSREESLPTTTGYETAIVSDTGELFSTPVVDVGFSGEIRASADAGDGEGVVFVSREVFSPAVPAVGFDAGEV